MSSLSMSLFPGQRGIYRFPKFLFPTWRTSTQEYCTAGRECQRSDSPFSLEMVRSTPVHKTLKPGEMTLHRQLHRLIADSGIRHAVHI